MVLAPFALKRASRVEQRAKQRGTKKIAAQARWQSSPPAYQGMTAMGVDIAQGGNDRTVIAARYGGWYAPLVRKPGKECRTGTEVVALIVQGRRNNCPVVIDVGGGWGTEAVGALERNGIPVVPYRGLMPSLATTRDGNLNSLPRTRPKRGIRWWEPRLSKPGKQGL